VGYYGDFEVRGFPIDSGHWPGRFNGMTIAGEQDVPLEKQAERRVSSKASPAWESGVASAGGLIDYVTKRPTTIEAVDLASDHRGKKH